jgi:DNA-binding transcriptional ArsR family regulator
MSLSKRIREEILDALRGSDAPLARKDLVPQCPTAETAQQISMALHDLKRADIVERNEDGTWQIAGQAEHEITWTPAAPAVDMAEPVEKILTEKPAPDGYWYQEIPDIATKTTQRMLADHARAAREILEAYIEDHADPVLRHLVQAAGAADRALEEYTARTEVA